MRRVAVIALITLSLSAVAAGCGSGGNGDVTTDATTAPVLVASSPSARPAAPDFMGTTIDGQQVSLKGYGGKPLILVFWGSW